MATLQVPRGEAKRAIETCIRAGTDLVTKAKIAESTGRYEDWLHIVTKWREKTAANLTTIYEEREIARQFTNVTGTTERSSPSFTFPYAKSALELGLFWLGTLIDGLPLAIGKSPDATAIESLHPAIYSKCRGPYESGDYAGAVEKSFKVVRARLRELTGKERGDLAFGAGLHVEGAVAEHVDDDLQHGVQFLTMAIDRFRNEKVHTDSEIDDPVRAYEYLRLSSLAMHFLDRAQIRLS